MLLLASCILAACTRSSPNIQLVQADSLIQKFPDSALHFLQGIQPKGLHLAADRAYYALLLTQVKDKNFIHQTEDSLIRIAVQYYDSTKNTAMQARAHYYLGCIWRNKDYHPEALKEFFKAITYSKRIFDNSLTGHIYNNIAYLYYLQRLNEELSQIEQHHLKTIYIGGGTPSALNDEQLEKLMSMLKTYSLEVEEYCMEVNPESMDYYKLKILKKGGINRLSIGVQTFQDHLLKEIDRHHNTTQVKNIIKYAKEIGFDNISIDLMYGLPKQTKEDIQKDIEVLQTLNLQHVSYYSLILEEGTILKYKNYQPLDEESEYQLTLFIDQELEKIGFEKYEISNYAKQGYQSKHNLTYWYYDNYYGIGLGACSKIDGQIIEHSRSLTKYLNGDFKTTTIDETKEETMFNQIMMSLRLKEGLDLKKFKERYQEDACILYKEEVTRNIEKGRLMIENDYLKATQEGQYVLNDILIDFMK